MRSTAWELMRLSEAFDGEFDPADFAPEELEELLGRIDGEMSIEQVREAYFSFYDDVKDRTLKKGKWSD